MKSKAISTGALSRGGLVLSWTEMQALQLDAFKRQFAAGVRWLRRIYALQGIGEAEAPAPASGLRHASEEARAAILATNLSASHKRFLLGAETVEAFLGGQGVLAPLEWLSKEICREDYSRGRLQSTAARRVCRWSENWSPRWEGRLCLAKQAV